MTLTDETKQKIIDDAKNWEDVMYAGKSLEERQGLGAFFTPPELVIRMIEKFDDMEGSILDPTCGGGSLLAGCILAGADPKKIYGIEIDGNFLSVSQERLGKMGVPKENIHQGDALESSCYEFPSGSETYQYDPDTHKGSILKNGKPRFRFGRAV